MKAQFDNTVMSSFYLWFDHILLTKGEAFTNFSSFFYEADDMYQGYNAYGAPFKQLVSDTSVTGATVLNTLILNNTSISRGQQNFAAVNYDKGHVYFSNPVANVSTSLRGHYAVKDFNVHITNDLEEKLLFETQYKLRNKTDATAQAIAHGTKTYPAVFLKNNGGQNEPMTMGGGDLTSIDVRAIVLSDSQFKMDAVASIFRDKAKSLIPLVDETDMPFNSLGDYTNVANPYHYKSLSSTSLQNNKSIFLDKVYISKIGGLSFAQKANANPDVFSMFIDFELNELRWPRS
jgi:hypothetical protein